MFVLSEINFCKMCEKCMCLFLRKEKVYIFISFHMFLVVVISLIYNSKEWRARLDML